jgi:hypothetical protein
MSSSSNGNGAYAEDVEDVVAPSDLTELLARFGEITGSPGCRIKGKPEDREKRRRESREMIRSFLPNDAEFARLLALYQDRNNGPPRVRIELARRLPLTA